MLPVVLLARATRPAGQPPAAAWRIKGRTSSGAAAGLVRCGREAHRGGAAQHRVAAARRGLLVDELNVHLVLRHLTGSDYGTFWDKAYNKSIVKGFAEEMYASRPSDQALREEDGVLVLVGRICHIIEGLVNAILGRI